MTSHELADMIYSLKEKLTDKEYKDIMEKLSVKKKEEEEAGNVYVLKYVITKIKMTYIGVEEWEEGERELGYNFNSKIKTKKVILGKGGGTREYLIKYNNNNDDAEDEYHFKLYKNKNQYPVLNCFDGKPKCTKLHHPTLHTIKEDELPSNGDIYITYQEILPISLKLST
jgi:hypothetical protein